MNFHRAFCDPKLYCDSFICEPLRYQLGYFRFPSRQLMHSTLPIFGHSPRTRMERSAPPRMYKIAHLYGRKAVKLVYPDNIR
jgi:hypothetical protein